MRHTMHVCVYYTHDGKHHLYILNILKQWDTAMIVHDGLGRCSTLMFLRLFFLLEGMTGLSFVGKPDRFLFRRHSLV